MSNDEKWALNVALIGDKKTVKKILKGLNKLEENGAIEDLTGIEGPFDSLQKMLKRRVDNLALNTSTETSPTQIERPQQTSDEFEDDSLEDDSFEDDSFEDDLFEDDLFEDDSLEDNVDSDKNWFEDENE